MATPRSSGSHPDGDTADGRKDKHGSDRARGQATDTGARPDLDQNEPDSPTKLSKTSLLAVVKRAAKEFKHDNLTDLAAALTYYAVLSIVPGLIVLISLLGLMGPDLTNQVMGQVQQVAPGSSADFVRTLITQAGRGGHWSHPRHRGGAVVGLRLRRRLHAGVERRLRHR